MTGAVELRAALASGERRVEDAVEDALDRIARRDGAVGAFHEVRAHEARARARELDLLRKRGGALPLLFGLPVALKENLCLADASVPCGAACSRAGARRTPRRSCAACSTPGPWPSA